MLLLSNRLDPRLKELAELKTAGLEKSVLEFAEAMTVTPAVDIDALRTQLLTHLSKAQLTELAAAIAWENQRARLNQGLGVRPTGIAEGMVCALPER